MSKKKTATNTTTQLNSSPQSVTKKDKDKDNEQINNSDIFIPYPLTQSESLIPQSQLKKRIYEHEQGKGTDKTPKMWKLLEEFWKKITNRKDLKGELDLNSADLFWYILWKSDWNPKSMVKEYDLLVENFQTSNGSELLDDHKQMSKWFSKAWDQFNDGLLDWHEFITGWVLATCGGNETERLGVLFKAIDRDGDTYLRCQDIIDYCIDVLDLSITTVDYSTISLTVTQIFNDMNRSGPFDAISLEEFIAYAEAHPDGLFATWGRILQYKVLEKPEKTNTSSRSALLNEIRSHNKPLRRASQEEKRVKHKIIKFSHDTNSTELSEESDDIHCKAQSNTNLLDDLHEERETKSRKRSTSESKEKQSNIEPNDPSKKLKKRHSNISHKSDFLDGKRSFSSGSKIQKKTKKKTAQSFKVSNENQFSPMAKTLEQNEEND